MRGRIYTCHHLVPDRVLSTSLFASLISGAPDDPASGLLGDLGHANIASPNLHSEMRHQWHVWRERLDGLDFVGFEHHRRVFFLQPLDIRTLGLFDSALGAVARRFETNHNLFGESLDDRAFRRYLDLREVCADAIEALAATLMERHDAVTQRLQPQRIDLQWKQCHPPAEWDLLVEAVRRTGFFASSHGLIDFTLESVCFCSMHIMRRALFGEYMAFWTECMAYLEPRIEHRDRHFGYFSERLLNFFLHGRRLQDPRFSAASLPFVIHAA